MLIINVRLSNPHFVMMHLYILQWYNIHLNNINGVYGETIWELVVINVSQGMRVCMSMDNYSIPMLVVRVPICKIIRPWIRIQIWFPIVEHMDWVILKFIVKVVEIILFWILINQFVMLDQLVVWFPIRVQIVKFVKRIDLLLMVNVNRHQFNFVKFLKMHSIMSLLDVNNVSPIII